MEDSPPPSSEHARALYLDGRLSEVVDLINGLGSTSNGDHRLIQAMALFDRGDVSKALETFDELSAASQEAPPQLRFDVELQRFLRAAAFLPVSEMAPRLARLRQLATAIGDSASIASLHLAVAKLESLRGSVLDAGTHVDIARRLSTEADLGGIQSSVELVAANLDVYAGNIERARRTALRGFETSSSTLVSLTFAVQRRKRC